MLQDHECVQSPQDFMDYKLRSGGTTLKSLLNFENNFNLEGHSRWETVDC